MKKTVITLAVVAFAAAAVQATTTSANIVGYSKDTVQSGLKISTFQFSAGSGLASEVYGDSLTEGTKLYTYNGGSGYGAISTYETYFDLNTFQNVTGWNPSVTIGVGDGVWYEAVSGFEWVANRPFDVN